LPEKVSLGKPQINLSGGIPDTFKTQSTSSIHYNGIGLLYKLVHFIKWLYCLNYNMDYNMISMNNVQWQRSHRRLPKWVVNAPYPQKKWVDGTIMKGIRKDRKLFLAVYS